MSKAKFEFEVDRKTWARGDNDGKDTYLLCDDGKMCCLGFFMRACRVPKKELLEVPAPSEVAIDRNCDGRSFPKKAAFLVNGDLDWFSSGSIAEILITGINDNKEITDAQREKQLKKEFAKHDITIKFTGKR